jgi:Flp pilus assembly protein TadG
MNVLKHQQGFRQADNGSILILSVFALSVYVLAVGYVLTISRSFYVRSVVENAAMTATRAAAFEFVQSEGAEDKVMRTALKYYQVNVSPKWGKIDRHNVVINNIEKKIELDVLITLPAVMGILPPSVVRVKEISKW